MDHLDEWSGKSGHLEKTREILRNGLLWQTIGLMRSALKVALIVMHGPSIVQLLVSLWIAEWRGDMVIHVTNARIIAFVHYCT